MRLVRPSRRYAIKSDPYPEQSEAVLIRRGGDSCFARRSAQFCANAFTRSSCERNVSLETTSCLIDLLSTHRSRNVFVMTTWKRLRHADTNKKFKHAAAYKFTILPRHSSDLRQIVRLILPAANPPCTHRYLSLVRFGHMSAQRFV